jgi:hypothetical protein
MKLRRYSREVVKKNAKDTEVEEIKKKQQRRRIYKF